MTLPDLPDGFHWTEEAWGPALRCRPLAAAAAHVFASRRLEWQTPAGRERTMAAVGARRVATLVQVHGRTVVAIRRGGTAPDDPPEGDILVSDDPDVALLVRAADCVPLLLADRRRGVVAAVHAGWRGTAARAAVAAVEALAREFGSRPADLVAAIGPAIGGCCYEVGPELVDAFAAAGHDRRLVDRWFLAPPPPRGSRTRPPLRLDLTGATRDQLCLAGLPGEQIHTAGLCTAEHLDVLTSWRAEGERAGRLAVIIGAAG